MLCVLTDYVLAHFIQGIGKVLSLQRTVNMKHSLPVLPNKVHQHLQTFQHRIYFYRLLKCLIYFPLKRTFHHIRNIPEMVIKCITVHPAALYNILNCNLRQRLLIEQFK